MSDMEFAPLCARYPLCALFQICNTDKDYVQVKRNGYEVDDKFVEIEDALLIFFEPSDSDIDWRVNFSFWRAPYKEMDIGYKGHSGFINSWKLIDDEVRAKVTEKGADGKYKWKYIVSIGYSHGGPLSALCHEMVWYEREDLRDGKILGINFDGPRMFAGYVVPSALKERWAHFYNFRNHDDIVAHMPPVLFGYRHVGEVIKMGTQEAIDAVHAHYPKQILKSLMELEEDWVLEMPEAVVNGLKCTRADILDAIEKARGK